MSKVHSLPRFPKNTFIAQTHTAHVALGFAHTVDMAKPAQAAFGEYDKDGDRLCLSTGDLILQRNAQYLTEAFPMVDI